MSDYEVLKEAIESGHKASSLLRDLAVFVADNCTCPEANGVHGPETYTDCGECWVCIAKKFKQEGVI